MGILGAVAFWDSFLFFSALLLLLLMMMMDSRAGDDGEDGEAGEDGEDGEWSPTSCKESWGVKN